MKELFALIGTVVVGTLQFLVGLIFALLFGYILGMVIAIIPFISDWMTFNGALDKRQFPSITAWLAVAALFVRIPEKGDDAK